MGKKWMESFCLLAVAMLLLGVCAMPALGYSDWGSGSNIHRGNLEVTVDKSKVTVAVDKTVSVTAAVYPWSDRQLPGCEMAECPDICGEKNCLTEDGLNCKCAGMTWQTYETQIAVASSDPGIATASYSDKKVMIEGVSEGTAVITVKGTLREWTEDEAEISVTVSGSTGNSSGGGGGSTTETATAVTVSLDWNGKATIAAASLQKASEVKVSGVAELVLDANALKTIGVNKDLVVSAVKVDNKTLSSSLQKKIGNRPVFDIDLTSGGKAVTDLGQGQLQISIPYALAKGEKAEQIIVYYIDAAGNAVEMEGARYDGTAKAVVFTTNHLSRYAIGYEEPTGYEEPEEPKEPEGYGEPAGSGESVSFTDVPGTHWASSYILDLANKGIVNGKTATAFAPDDTINRAEFVKILAGVAGADVGTAGSSAFSDVAVEAWYAPYVAWASEAGITKGDDGKFNPNAQITRQDMAVMLARYIQDVAQKTLPEKNAAVTFNDEAAIGAYAKDAVGMMQKAGIIGGNETGAFLPANPATRAEAAKMISILMSLLS
jgi:hypothetical protein